MNDYRAAGQELPGQVLAAARKGQERVTKSVRNVTTAAQQIRPQLANMSRPTFSVSALPSPAQLREKAPEFMAKLPARLPARLQPMLPSRLPNRLSNRVPSTEQLRTSAQEFAGHARSVQRLVTDQVRGVATPLAHQAAARLAQVGLPTPGTSSAKTGPKTGTTTKVSEVTVTKASQPGPTAKPDPAAKSSRSGSTAAADEPAKPKTSPSKPSTAKPSTAKPSTAKPSTTKPGTTKPGTTKPKTGPADK